MNGMHELLVAPKFESFNERCTKRRSSGSAVTTTAHTCVCWHAISVGTMGLTVETSRAG